MQFHYTAKSKFRLPPIPTEFHKNSETSPSKISPGAGCSMNLWLLNREWRDNIARDERTCSLPCESPERIAHRYAADVLFGHPCRPQVGQEGLCQIGERLGDPAARLRRCIPAAVMAQ